MPTRANISAQPQGLPALNNGGHEKSDLSAGWIFWSFAALFLAGVAIQAVVGLQVVSLRKQPPKLDKWTIPKRAATEFPPRSYPKLQLSPPADFEAFRAREEAELNSYGWVDKKGGVARIPIQRAMELLLQTGIPELSRTNEGRVGPSNLQLQQRRPLQAEPERRNP